VKYHPSSVDNLLVSQLLERTSQKDLATFLHRDLQGVDRGVAERICAELGPWASDLAPPRSRRAPKGKEEMMMMLDAVVRLPVFDDTLLDISPLRYQLSFALHLISSLVLLASLWV
jgi:DNA topoisomerase VI subunit B